MNTDGMQRLAGQSAFLQAEGEDCTVQRCQPCLWIFLLQVETFSESEKEAVIRNTNVQKRFGDL